MDQIIPTECEHTQWPIWFVTLFLQREKESKQKCELEWTILKLDNYDKGKTAWLAAQIFWRYKWRSNSG